MKANRCFVEEKEGVSAVVGVILMVLITIAIAATVYYYVAYVYDQETPEEELSIEGTVTSVAEVGTYSEPATSNETWPVYNITLDETNSYQMMFRSEGAQVPPVDTEVRLYYDLIELGDDVYYDVYKIKSL